MKSSTNPEQKKCEDNHTKKYSQREKGRVGESERELNQERLWIPGNKLRILEGRGRGMCWPSDGY